MQIQSENSKLIDISPYAVVDELPIHKSDKKSFKGFSGMLVVVGEKTNRKIEFRPILFIIIGIIIYSFRPDLPKKELRVKTYDIISWERKK